MTDGTAVEQIAHYRRSLRRFLNKRSCFLSFSPFLVLELSKFTKMKMSPFVNNIFIPVSSFLQFFRENLSVLSGERKYGGKIKDEEHPYTWPEGYVVSDMATFILS